MTTEKQTKEFKSIRKIRTGDKSFKELATTGGRTYRRYELSDGRKEKK